MDDIKMCDCGRPQRPYTMRIGRRLPTWWVQCYCGERTENHKSSKRAIAAWNQGERRERKQEPTE